MEFLSRTLVLVEFRNNILLRLLQLWKMKCINDIIQYPVFYEMFDNEKLKYLNNQKSSRVLICTYPCTCHSMT